MKIDKDKITYRIINHNEGQQSVMACYKFKTSKGDCEMEESLDVEEQALEKLQKNYDSNKKYYERP